MQLLHGNMWNWREGIRVVTGNSFLRKDGALVMGRGAANQLCVQVPGINLLFGKEIKRICGHLGKYGLIMLNYPYDYGIFQVKYHFKDKADLNLISYSVEKLRSWCWVYQSINIHMNYPGIGNGRLSAEEVKPIIDRLPDNVYIYWR